MREIVSGVLALLWASLNPAAGQERVAVPGAWLSWDARELIGEGPEPEGGALRATVFLHVAVAEPLDSLGCALRWLASDPGAEIALRGVGPQPSSMRPEFVPADTAAGAEPRAALNAWTSSAGYLAEVAQRDEDGVWWYRIGFDLEGGGVRALRVVASRLTARLSSGEELNLGAPEASLGSGWQLQAPPLITGLQGRLNKRFLRSVLAVRGVDLDRLVGLELLDSQGRRILPVGLDLLSPHRLEVTFANSQVSEGPCDLVYHGPDGVPRRLERAVRAAYLEERRIGDTNLGSKPGRED